MVNIHIYVIWNIGLACRKLKCRTFLKFHGLHVGKENREYIFSVKSKTHYYPHVVIIEKKSRNQP